jgi:carbonic anhydrase
MPKRFEEEMATLLAGYKQFRQRYFAQNEHVFKKLASQGQKPKTMIISCSDSRVDPSIILDCSPGEIFAVRNVANLVPTYFDRPKNESIGAALEFAVRYLGVQQIIVLGHSSCGGIKTLMEMDPTQSNEDKTSPEKTFIQDWVKIAKDAKDKTQAAHKDLPAAEKAKICEEQALLVSLKNLETYPWIKIKMQTGELSLHAWRFDIRAGLIQRYNQDTTHFEDLNPANLEAKQAAPTGATFIASKL